jgi:hypothetical protein
MQSQSGDRLNLCAHLNKIIEGTDVSESIGSAEKIIRDSLKEADAVLQQSLMLKDGGLLYERSEYLELGTVGHYRGRRKRIKNGAIFTFKRENGLAVEFYFRRGNYTFEQLLTEVCARYNDIDYESCQIVAEGINEEARSQGSREKKLFRNYEELLLGRTALSVTGYVLERVDIVTRRPRVVRGMTLPAAILPVEERQTWLL